MARRNLKERVKTGETVFGTWCLMPSPHSISVLAGSGLDFIIIDMEHGPIDFTILSEMIMAAEGKCDIIVRVADNDKAMIQQALDSGASGILVPHVDSREERDRSVSYSKYPPVGTRGFSPFAKAGGYSGSALDTGRVNESVLVGVMVEGKKGLENLESIVDDENVDLAYVGTYDISASMGIPGQVENQKVEAALQKAVKQIRNKKKAAGCMANDAQGLKKLKQMGITVLLYKTDVSMLTDSAREIVKELKQK